MKLFLFGGAETSLNQTPIELKQIETVIRETGAKQVFHIPFARIDVTEGSWAGDWFHRYIDLPGVEYLNAKNEDDIARANNPLVFISGGSANINLLEKINANPKILRLIENAEYIIGESAGSMVLGSYLSTGSKDGEYKILKGLGIIKDTIVEPHYTQRNKQEQLAKEMKETGARYGIGIDSITAIEFELDEFPEKYKKIGDGMVEILK